MLIHKFFGTFLQIFYFGTEFKLHGATPAVCARPLRYGPSTPVTDNIIGQVREALTLLNFRLNEGARCDPVRTGKTFR